MFNIGRYPLGIMAPAAVKRTSFKKHRGADTRTVMYGKSFYVKNAGFHG
jgi:hypothetical protein